MMCDALLTIKREIDCIENESTHEKCIHGAAAPTLLDLPVEIFLEICSFLDAGFLNSTLSKVCCRFENILADVELWRYWVKRRIKHTYPALPHLRMWDENDINWEEACKEIDTEYKKWTNVTKRMNHIVIKDVHYASIDTVLLVNAGEICISGGRDRGLALWKISSLKSHGYNDTQYVNAKPEKSLLDAHTGWVWDLAADSSDAARVIYSASWDNTVKAWDLATELSLLQTFQCGVSALSVVSCEDLVFTGLFSKTVLIFDIRVGPQPITSYKTHKRAVLALDTHKDKVASVSEDNTLAVWDRTAGKILASDIKMPTERALPVCINWSPAALYIGDSKGSIHIVDPEQFVNQGSHELWPEPEITLPANRIAGMHQGIGTMILCSSTGEIKFLYNSFPPEEFTSLKSATSEVTKLQYQNEVLAIGTCDCALEFWIPTDKDAS